MYYFILRSSTLPPDFGVLVHYLTGRMNGVSLGASLSLGPRDGWLCARGDLPHRRPVPGAGLPLGAPWAGTVGLVTCS